MGIQTMNHNARQDENTIDYCIEALSYLKSHCKSKLDKHAFKFALLDGLEF